MKKHNPQMLFGAHPILEAIEAGKTLDRVFIQSNTKSELISKIKLTLKDHQISWSSVPEEKLNRITSKNHQGVIAFVSPVSFGDVHHIVANTFESGHTPLLLMLDSITDVRNFGAIVRTAECMGVHAVIIPDKGSAQINEETMKASSGALHHMPICKVKNLYETLKLLQSSGLQVCVASEKARQYAKETDFKLPTCIVMGNEETGPSKSIMTLADYLILIPMVGRVQSLNVGVATGMLLYEVLRQRQEC
jgi:23S rRNA (guanosine2251-2'-O)-methyltransferase